MCAYGWWAYTQFLNVDSVQFSLLVDIVLDMFNQALEVWSSGHLSIRKWNWQLYLNNNKK